MESLNKDFGEGTKIFYCGGEELIVNLYSNGLSVFGGLACRHAHMSIERNGIIINPQHLITPELWHDEKAMQIIVADLAKFLY